MQQWTEQVLLVQMVHKLQQHSNWVGAALKIAINAKCTTELNNLPAWQTATKLMTADQKQEVQSNICGCVSDKAPENISAVDLATAALDPQARTTIVTNAVTKTINQCVTQAIQ